MRWTVPEHISAEQAPTTAEMTKGPDMKFIGGKPSRVFFVPATDPDAPTVAEIDSGVEIGETAIEPAELPPEWNEERETFTSVSANFTHDAIYTPAAFDLFKSKALIGAVFVGGRVFETFEDGSQREVVCPDPRDDWEPVPFASLTVDGQRLNLGPGWIKKDGTEIVTATHHLTWQAKE